MNLAQLKGCDGDLDRSARVLKKGQGSGEVAFGSFEARLAAQVAGAGV